MCISKENSGIIWYVLMGLRCRGDKNRVLLHVTNAWKYIYNYIFFNTHFYSTGEHFVFRKSFNLSGKKENIFYIIWAFMFIFYKIYQDNSFFRCTYFTLVPGLVALGSSLCNHRVLAFFGALHFSVQVVDRFEVNMYHIFQSRDQHPDEPIEELERQTWPHSSGW